MYATLKQRQKAREVVGDPGKFKNQSPMVPILYNIVLDGLSDETVDSGDRVYNRVGRWIIWEPLAGLVTGTRYSTQGKAAETMRNLYAVARLWWTRREHE